MMIIDYSKDDERTIRMKNFRFDCMNMLMLKSKKLWWEKDEKKFFEKYRIKTNRIKAK